MANSALGVLGGLCCFLLVYASAGQGYPVAQAAGVAAEAGVLSLDGRCQLRVFTINRGKMEEFRRAWLAGVHPLRLKHGFRIPAAWSVLETNQFMWLLCYSGSDSFESKDAAYYASTARQVLTPDPRELIARAEQWFVAPTIPAQ